MGIVADRIADRIAILTQRRADLMAQTQTAVAAITAEIQALRGIAIAAMTEKDLDQLATSGIIKKDLT